MRDNEQEWKELTRRILGIDRFLSMCRALVNMIGNAVATLVIARWENEFDRSDLQRRLLGEITEK